MFYVKVIPYSCILCSEKNNVKPLKCGEDTCKAKYKYPNIFRTVFS